jgi:hypothetical protein
MFNRECRLACVCVIVEKCRTCPAYYDIPESFLPITVFMQLNLTNK